MSISVEPLHYTFYNKIMLLQAIIEEIQELGDRYEIALKAECDQLFGTFESQSIDEFYNTQPDENINEWLQKLAAQTQYQYAYSAIKLLENKPELMESLSQILVRSGINLAVTLKEYYLTASGIYKAITENWIPTSIEGENDQVLLENDREVVWSSGNLINLYWEQLGGGSALYIELQEAWMSGFTQELGYQFDKMDFGTYRIHYNE
jgi:hypothetical protein